MRILATDCRHAAEGSRIGLATAGSKLTRAIVTLGIVLPLLLLSACVADVSIHPPLSAEAAVGAQRQPARPTEDPIRPLLPADVNINQDAGHGGLLYVTLRLRSGEELLFVADTGSPGTLLDKRLEPGLGQRLGTTTIWTLSGKQKGGVYLAPKFYLGATPLMGGSNIVAVDVKQILPRAGRPIMGILGMDCLRHYCIQLDFETRKMRFLDPDHLNPGALGKAFPVTLSSDDNAELFKPLIHHGGLLGGTGTNSVIDTGCNIDGMVERAAIKRYAAGSYAGSFTTRIKHFLAVEGLVKKGVALPQCVWDGNTYTNITVEKAPSDCPNWIGLKFLARHLVTLDFPKEVMYLKRTSAGLDPGDTSMKKAR